MQWYIATGKYREKLPNGHTQIWSFVTSIPASCLECAQQRFISDIPVLFPDNSNCRRKLLQQKRVIDSITPAKTNTLFFQKSLLEEQ